MELLRGNTRSRITIKPNSRKRKYKKRRDQNTLNWGQEWNKEIILWLPVEKNELLFADDVIQKMQNWLTLTDEIEKVQTEVI